MKTQIKTTKNFDKLIEAIKAGKLESNNQLTYMMSTINNNKDLKELIDEALEYQEIALDESQVKKGYDWLMDQWKTPKGAERKNNPFGYREQAIMMAIMTLVITITLIICLYTWFTATTARLSITSQVVKFI